MSNHETKVIDGQSAIAIIGVGAKMPGALTAPDFWQNIKNGVYAISDVPVDRWDPTLYWDPDPAAPDKTYSKIGGWVTGFEFDRKTYRLPPTVVEKTDPTQLLCLAAVREALDDAGYLERDFDRDRCAVILGNALGGDLRDETNLRIQYAELNQALRTALLDLSIGNLDANQVEDLLATVEKRVKSTMVPVNEDSMPGELANVIAGRVAQTFDLRGPNFVCDAACASTLAALESAIQGLRSNQFDMAVAGGADRTMGPPSYVKFSKIGALSADGSRPFDAGANGFVMGEGAGIIILKRLADAIRDEDNIYAVIRGIGGSSDGRGKGITAPNPRGQELAVRRAFQDAGVGPKTVSLIEAHGTSTPVGDPAEVESLRHVFEQDDTVVPAGSIALGSVKSMIGHLKSAAAAASIVKVAFALRDNLLPPSINIETPNPALQLDGGPFRLQRELQPWETHDGGPRRAGISAFGFGGTNFHVVLEEYDPSSRDGISRGRDGKIFSMSSGSTTAMAAPAPAAAGDGIIALAADDLDAMRGAFGAFAAQFAAAPQQALAEHSLELSDANAAPEGRVRLSVVYDSVEELAAKIGRIEKALTSNKGWKVLENAGVFLSEAPIGGKVGMLFPGQGTQYLGMLSDLRARFPQVEATIAEADSIMAPLLDEPLSHIMYPDLDEVDQGDAFLKLSQTEITQPAVLTANAAIFRTLGSMGIRPDVVAGHSLGEYGACIAAGVMTFEEALRTVARRGTEMANATPMNGDPGLMAGIAMPADEVEQVLRDIDGYVVCANKNCSRQTIIAGLTEAVQQAKQKFEEAGHDVVLLPVSHAFHSRVVAAASEPLRRHLSTIDVQVPHTPILTNVTGDFYPDKPGSEDEIRDLLSEQVAAPVEFIALINRMYDAGVRVFVEVGPKRAQTTFVSDILEGRPHVALFTNHPKKGDVRSLLDALAQLWATGAWGKHDSRPAELVQTVELDAPVAAMDARPTSPAVPSPAQGASVDLDGVLATLLTVLCEKTGYDRDEIEPEFELEADLGIDTVKQAEIMAAVREDYGLDKDDEFRLAEYPSLLDLARYVVERAPAGPVGEPTRPLEPLSAPPLVGAVAHPDALALMIDVLCEKTGYDRDEIEPEFELEADLGIDTVKQAEIMAAVREHYGFDRDEEFRLADYPTLDDLARYVVEAAASGPAPEAPKTPQVVEAPAQAAAAVPGVSHDSALQLMVQILCEKTGYDPDEIEPEFELEADLGIDTVKQAEIMAAVREHYGLERDDDFRLAEYPTLEALAGYVVERSPDANDATVVRAPAEAPVAAAQPIQQVPGASGEEALALMVSVLCEKTGYDPDEIEPQFELEADLGIDTVKQAEIMTAVREHYGFERDDDFRFADYPTLEDLARYVVDRLGVPSATQPPAAAPVPSSTPEAPAPLEAAPPQPVRPPAPTAPEVELPPTRTFTPSSTPDVSITGCALGVPGLDELFSARAVESLMSGRNMIGDIPAADRTAMASKGITRLVKDPGGGGEMVPVDDPADVLKLAGRAGEFDLTEFDISDRLVDSLDRTSQMAIAAGLLALADAGLPLVPRYRTTTSGKKITIGWTLPEQVGAETGVIFASAFAGQDYLAAEVGRSAEDDYEFDHRFLLKMLGIANSRFAEFVGARGPNTKVNNACASTTMAISLAQDWIRLGRCKRVVVLGADDASGDSLMQWIGSGFLATGAATTEADVAEAALPFDRRRNGMIIGMGAVAMVVEQAGLAEARGIEPLADVLATRIANSALHPTRLDPDHIAAEVGALVSEVEARYGVAREEMAEKTVFVSHETYTPARGGSAATEIESLRRTFGEHANRVVVANTKGFTGHAMGAGIEDILAVKALQFEKLPHIANFKEPDPDLGDLRLSQGGDYPLDYALRLAAGFGSQLALALLRFRARGEDRTTSPTAYAQWLSQVSGFSAPVVTTEHRTLRCREGISEEEVASSLAMDSIAEQEWIAQQELPVAAEGSSNHVRRAPMKEEPKPASAPVAEAKFDQLGVVVEALATESYDLGALKGVLDGRRVAMLGGPLVVTELFTSALQRCGASVLHLASSAERSPLDGDTTVCDLNDEDAIAAAFAEFGGVDGILNLVGFGGERYAADDVYNAARYSFHAARAWRASLGHAPTQDNFFVTVTGMGGRLGFDRAAGPLPVCGAVAGFTKALGREWTDAKVAVVDVARTGYRAGFGLEVLNEALLVRHHLEVGLIGGLRYVPATVAADEIRAEDLDSFAPGKGDVVIVTGGAKGITAEVALDLAERFGCSLALVGRTAMTHPDPLGVDLDAEKKRVKAELSKSGGRVTPVMVRDAMRGLESQRTIAANVARMRAAGSEVEYFSCDVADGDSVRAMVDAVVARFSAVHGIVHGAGVEESRLIEDKDLAGFDRVFRGKAMGALHLWNAVSPLNPQFFVAFSSVAGRYGNPGQVDYSAANEVLNKLVALLNANGDVHATSIDWTAWDEVGMAADGSMKMLLEARGVDLLPPEVGAPMVGDFLEAAMAGEFVVAGRLGDFQQEQAPATQARPQIVDKPLVAEVIESSNESIVVARTFDVEHDAFVRDHVYQGTPLVPGVIGFEMMVEAAQMLLGQEAIVVEDVEFGHALKLHRGEPVRAIATAQRRGSDVRVRVETIRSTKTGREVETLHYQATVKTSSAPRLEPFTLDASAEWLRGPEADAIYARYFHTGTFQVLERVPYIAEDGVIAYGRVPHGALTDRASNSAMSTDPTVREMGFQAAGLLGMIHEGRSYLPYSVGRAELFGKADAGQLVCIRVRTRDDADEHMAAFDIDIVDERGRVLQRMERVQMVRHTSLPAEARFPDFAEECIRVTAHPAASNEAAMAALNASFDTVILDEERSGYDRLISERRRGEWLAARLLAKREVAAWLRDFRGMAVALGDIAIRKNEERAPRAELVAGGIELPELSLTHSNGVATLAFAVTGSRSRVGIDVEVIEARDDAFVKNYFTPDELSLRGSWDLSTHIAILWSLKEAVSKALGLGLKLRLDEMLVTGLQPTSEGVNATIELRGMARERFVDLGGSHLHCESRWNDRQAESLADLHVQRGVPAHVSSPTEPREVLQLAAVAALLKHKGLISDGGPGQVLRSDLPSWKS